MLFPPPASPTSFFIIVFIREPGLLESSQVNEWVCVILALRSEGRQHFMGSQRVNVLLKCFQNHLILLSLNTNAATGNMEVNDYVFQLNGPGLYIWSLECAY